nr:putative ribonuclease H-like domain-containing protein [Tanacetum cinerariifolium]
YQMDVKSSFLYGTTDEEVYVMQPPRAWYDIMFAVYAYARHQMTPKECHLHAVKRIFRYLKGHPKLWLWYPKESPFELVAYSDNDYGGATQDRKSTNGGCQFLGGKLISWQCKQQTIVATSITEEEYVAAVGMPCEALSREFSTSILRLLCHNEGLLQDLLEYLTFEALQCDFLFIDQDRATIDKSSTLPHDLAPRVTSPVANEGSMQQTILKLTALCTSLQRQLSELTAKFQAQEVEINKLKERVKLLEDRDGMATTRSGDDAPIKGRSMDEGEAVTKRISDESEEMATVLTSMDAATVLASGVVDVSTGSGSIPIASTLTEEQVPTGSDVVPTASPVFATAAVVTPYRRRKGNKVMVESETPKKQNVQEQIDAQLARELEEQLEREDQRSFEQIARDAEIARIHTEEEL